MKRENIKERIISILFEEFDVDFGNLTFQSVNENLRLDEDLHLTLLEEAQFLIRIENEFEILISDRETKSIQTIKDAIDIVYRYLNG